MSHRRRNQKGSIILIAVILLLVIGAMAFITMTRDRVRNRAFEKTSEIVGVKLLRRYFNIGHDCARTRVLNAGACGAGYIDLGRVGSVTLLVDFDACRFRFGSFCFGYEDRRFLVKSKVYRGHTGAADDTGRILAKIEQSSFHRLEGVVRHLSGVQLMKLLSGFAMLEIIIGSVILFVVAGSFFGMEFQRRRMVAKSIVQGESIDALRNLEQLLDCRKTFTNIPTDLTRVAECSSVNSKTVARYIDLRDAANQVILAKFDPTNEPAASHMGKLSIRARCIWQDGFYGILLEYRKLVDPPGTLWKRIASEVPIACGV